MNKTGVYRIQTITSQDIEVAKKQFKADYRMLKYQKDTLYPDLVVVMGLSKNDGFMSKVVNENEGKRGRPKKKFVRSDIPPLYNSPFNHETDLHMHIYIAGKGSATVAQRLRELRNKKAKKIVYEQWKQDDGRIPYDYVENQSLGGCFARIGNYYEYM